ncbi:MAG: peptidase U62 [Acidobacteria bacterium]|nr:peptidase U62 [Acidobacteriota bacterium]
MIFTLAAGGLRAQQPSPLLRILEQEIGRNFGVLKEKADPPPYFLSYTVVESEGNVIAATMGAVTGQNHSNSRLLDVTVRVGSPALDNYHRTANDRPQFSSLVAIPVEDGEAAIRRACWLETDRIYRAASQRLIQIKTNQQVQVSRDDDSADFSKEDPAQYTGATPKLSFPAAEWTNRLRKLSARFSNYPGVLNSTVAVAAQRETKYLVNTEGSRIQTGRTTAEIVITAQGKAADGMDLGVHESFQADDPSRLPKDEVILAAIDKAGRDLEGLLHAPVVEPYIGPAILSGRAAGVFFHEIFGHRIEGHRQKDEAEGQTFTKSVGQPVLPEFLSVIFDPTRTNLSGTFLNGAYVYDDEGVKARPVTAVDHGVLKTFLLSRSPIKGFSHSNGHGRRQIGADVVSRQSNLIVESSKTVSDERLKEMLREELKRQNKPWGLYFSRVTGGYTTTQRRGLQAFTVIPLVVYRVFVDGRPDELVRGVDIVGTPLASFAKIVATSDKLEVFNGVCGAESGSVPVSASAPAILISEIEIQKKEHSQDRPPLLSRPLGEGN